MNPIPIFTRKDMVKGYLHYGTRSCAMGHFQRHNIKSRTRWYVFRSAYLRAARTLFPDRPLVEDNLNGRPTVPYINDVVCRSTQERADVLNLTIDFLGIPRTPTIKEDEVSPAARTLASV